MYCQSNGRLFTDPLSDFSWYEGGLTQGVARLNLDKRADIEKAFADSNRLGGKSNDCGFAEVAILKRSRMGVLSP